MSELLAIVQTCPSSVDTNFSTFASVWVMNLKFIRLQFVPA
jgi:hypothetical protein